MRIAILLLCVFLLAACSGLPGGGLAATTTPALPAPVDILCTTAYRSAVTVPIEAEQSVRITPENPSAEFAFPDMVWSAQFIDGEGFETSSIIVQVTTSGPRDVIASVLFQLPRERELANQFVSHGFSGLNYIYHPETGAELQYWCEVE